MFAFLAQGLELLVEVGDDNLVKSVRTLGPIIRCGDRVRPLGIGSVYNMAEGMVQRFRPPDELGVGMGDDIVEVWFAWQGPKEQGSKFLWVSPRNILHFAQKPPDDPAPGQGEKIQEKAMTATVAMNAGSLARLFGCED